MRHITKPLWISFFFLVTICLFVALFFLLAVKKTDRSIVLYGNVDVRQVDIGFRVYGKILEMPFEEGDFVAKGDFTACIDPQPYADEVKKADANLQAIKLSLDNFEQIFMRRQELVGEGGVSQEDYENAKTARDVALEQVKEARAALGVAQNRFTQYKSLLPCRWNYFNPRKRARNCCAAGRTCLHPFFNFASVGQSLCARTFIRRHLSWHGCGNFHRYKREKLPRQNRLYFPCRGIYSKNSSIDRTEN